MRLQTEKQQLLLLESNAKERSMMSEQLTESTICDSSTTKAKQLPIAISEQTEISKKAEMKRNPKTMKMLEIETSLRRSKCQYSMEKIMIRGYFAPKGISISINLPTKETAHHGVILGLGTAIQGKGICEALQICIKGDPSLTKAQVSLKSMIKSWEELDEGFLIECRAIEVDNVVKLM
ncbi:ty3-gypsy retroelement transposase [Cucumis melo var. makuwa]|uniref:Ty3-gypsy retroelement transposase n=1 Tax=Cucumis melo var. makuwa TaxID=1194695 RepID=A0A5D3C772_CUCMM|nr:ty3-gypsy retroelement transposase [Cucumis melo var. makuwa]